MNKKTCSERNKILNCENSVVPGKEQRERLGKTTYWKELWKELTLGMKGE